MNLEVVATSAVAAGVVSAVCTALFSLLHFHVEAREKRWEMRTANLRDAVVDFLTASRALHEKDWAMREAISDRSVTDADGSPVYDRVEMNAEVERFSRAIEAADEATENALSRIQLYSPALHAKTRAILAVKVNAEGKADREVALAEFLVAARSELRIGSLEGPELRLWRRRSRD
ncbi:hypothetical protein [Promicromonospora sp. NPDC060271]|uniref:hypothetical protein n=1 Tax=Promicromonospora sp. NPDC060271 TaxID=3347089 RepID=UPI00365D1439